MRRRAIDPLAAGAAAFAAAELVLGLLVGGALGGSRAEALVFLAFRPWLIFAAALLIASWKWRRRLRFYLLALTASGLAEALFLWALGGHPWTEMLRGLAAGLGLALAIDLSLRLGGRAAGRIGRGAAAALILAAMLLGGLAPYERIVIGPSQARAATERPPLLLMTGLPLVWGESGPFDPASRPAAAFAQLQREFDVRPIDHIDAQSLAAAPLMLLAQPRWLEPGELVALDAWVRRGGRVLILADPDLRWPSRLPPGDVRRPAPTSLIGPLLDHWGVRLEAAGAGPEVHRLGPRGPQRRLVLDAAGRLTAQGPCRIRDFPWQAECALGDGRAIIVADADLLRDDLWVADMERGEARHARVADNALIVADWLDGLAGRERPRADGAVRWVSPNANRSAAMLLALLPILGLVAAGFVRKPQFTDLSTEVRMRTEEEP